MTATGVKEAAHPPRAGSPGRATDPKDPRRAPDRLRLRHEAYRKAIHLATIALPITVWFLPREAAIVLLAAGVGLALVVEWARRHVRWARYLFLTRTRHLLRPRERHGLAGATYMAVAYLLAFLLFPLQVAVAAMLYNALGDAVAALVGKRWGRHRVPGGKSLEGGAAGFAVNLVVGLVVPGILVVPALAGAAAAATIELAPIPVDDNLLVTLGGGAALAAALAML